MEAPNNIANQPLRLQVNEKPSYYNDEMLIGAGLGAIIPFGGLITAGIGAVVGAVIGESRMRREKDHGKEIKDPSFLNKGLAMGIIAPMAVVSILALPLATVATAISAPPLLFVGIAELGALAITPIIATIGAFSGKSDMVKEKEQAISQLQEFAMSQHYSKSREPEIVQEQDTPSKKFTALLEQQQQSQTQGLSANK